MFSATTKRAVKIYGIEACVEAFNLSERGFGANSISHLGLKNIKTTRQADAAINAGREIKNI